MATRNQLLREIYELTEGGSSENQVMCSDVIQHSGLPAPQAKADLKYLHGKHLIELDGVDASGNGLVTLTAEGIDAYEELLESSREVKVQPVPSDTNVGKTQSSMQIFISHSSKDEKLARHLIEVLQTAFSISPDAIRCTSVPGYKLPGGVSTDERLKIEVRESRLLIALLTPNSIKSPYVLFELGARWGANYDFIPFLAAGALIQDLGGPLQGINAILCDEDGVEHFLDTSQEILGAQRVRGSVYRKYIRELLEESQRNAEDSKNRQSSLFVPERVDQANFPLSQSTIPTLSTEAKELLIAASEDRNGTVTCIRPATGARISANGRSFVERGDNRSLALWESALEELLSHDLLRDEGFKREVLKITKYGYEVADRIKSEAEDNS